MYHNTCLTLVHFVWNQYEKQLLLILFGIYIAQQISGTPHENLKPDVINFLKDILAES